MFLNILPYKRMNISTLDVNLQLPAEDRLKIVDRREMPQVQRGTQMRLCIVDHRHFRTPTSLHLDPKLTCV